MNEVAVPLPLRALFVSSRRVEKPLICLLALAVGGCATLPSSGPTARAIVREERSESNLMGFRIVDIDTGVVAQQAAAESGFGAKAQMAALARNGRVDVIGPGDVLQINVFEVGTPLFSGFGGPTALTDVPFDPSAKKGQVPGVPVDEDGNISLPYIGLLHVAGKTPFEVQRLIDGNLAGKSQSPQSVVRVAENIANTVLVTGLVRSPGRVPLTGARERLFDIVAKAGGVSSISAAGAANHPEDIVVRFTRGDQTVEVPYTSIRAGSSTDLTLLAGDRVDVLIRERSYTVFGATGKPAQTSFNADSLSLAEAVARAGGPNDATADPTAVFLFRYTPDPAKPESEAPIIYRLNMLKPSSYFLAQRFAMRDKDVIYIANSTANQPTKLIQIINLLFSPFFSVRAATR